MHFTSASNIKQEFKRDQSRHLQDITYICIILLFSGSIYPMCANPITTDESVNSTLKVSGMPFSRKLSNPCSLVNASNLQRSAIRNTSTNEEKKRFIQYLKRKAELIKTNAESILLTNLLTDCPTLVLPVVAIIPTIEEISNSTPMAALRLFYTSLLNHTAHVYFIGEQSKQYSTDMHCNRPGLPANADALALNMKELMCVLRLSTYVIQDETDEPETFQESIEQILNEDLSNQPSCSLRAIKDCQTIRSTTSLATVFLNYLNTLGTHFVETSTTQRPTENS